MKKETKEKFEKALAAYADAIDGMLDAIEAGVEDIGFLQFKQVNQNDDIVTRRIIKNENKEYVMVDSEGNEIDEIGDLDTHTLFGICLDFSN